MKVSVIVPIFKVEMFIERCVRSLMEQTLREVEYIFVDDASPDRSIEILHSTLADYPERQDQVRILTHEKNKGLPAARNTGLAVATGEYIFHCDSDDWIELDMLEQMYSVAMKSRSDYVACDFYMELKTERKILHTIDPCPTKEDLMIQYIQYGWTVIWNILASRDLYTKYTLRAYEGYTFCEDYGLSVRLLYHSKNFTVIHKPFYHYNRCNIHSIVAKANLPETLLRNTEAQIYIYTQINTFFKSHNFFQPLSQVLSWRMLSAKRGWLYIPNRWNEYRKTAPEANQHIWSNPLCSFKDKICQTFMLHRMSAYLIYIIKFTDNLINKFRG